MAMFLVFKARFFQGNGFSSGPGSRSGSRSEDAQYDEQFQIFQKQSSQTIIFQGKVGRHLS